MDCLKHGWSSVQTGCPACFHGEAIGVGDQNQPYKLDLIIEALKRIEIILKSKETNRCISGKERPDG